jgi:1-acyl-sn-glycerol-3-phosphate acyltransferase
MAAGVGILLRLRATLLVLPWLIYLGLVDLVLSLLLPVKFLFPDWVQNICSGLAYTVWTWIQVIFELANGAKIGVTGDVLPEGESAIVVANHVSWTDFYMIQSLAIRAGMLGRCRWFAKIQLRWVPFLGWGLWAMGFPMVSRKWVKDKKELDRVFSGIVDRKWSTCELALASSRKVIDSFRAY